MKKYLSPFLMVFIGLLVLGVWTPSEALAWACSNNNLQRLVAEFAYKDGSIAFTDQQPPGIVIYENDQVIVPDGCDTLYVTIAATAQEDDGMWLTCEVDFNFCNAGFDFGTGNTQGWVSIQHLPFAVVGGPTGIYYTWCTPITPGAHVVDIRMASDNVSSQVFLDFAHFYIDASFTGGGCVQAAPPVVPSPMAPALKPKLSIPALPGLH